MTCELVNPSKNIPFKWTEECQKCLDYIKLIITTSPILAYPNLDKRYYLFMDSSKHSWSGVLVQYHEQKQEDCTILNVTPSNYLSKLNFPGFPMKLEHVD